MLARTSPHIQQLVPADNWKVVSAGFQDYDYRTVRFDEKPIIAFGLTSDGRVIPLAQHASDVVDASDAAALSEIGWEVVVTRIVSPLDSTRMLTYELENEVKAKMDARRVA